MFRLLRASSANRLVSGAIMLAVCVLASFGLMSCGILGTDESVSNDVQVGTVMPISGDLSAYGETAQRSMDLAFELVNEAGGVNGGTISAIHRDSGTNEQIGTDSASGLVNVDGVNILIGAHSSGVTIAIAESVTIPAGVLHFTVGSSSKAISVLNDNDMVFRTRVNDHVKAQAVAKLTEAAGYQRVATTYINNAYGESLNESFVENFEKAGGTVVAEVSHELGQASYVSEVRDAAKDEPEVLVTIAYPDSGQTLLREAAESGLFEEFLFVDVTRNQTMRISRAGKLSRDFPKLHYIFRTNNISRLLFILIYSFGSFL